MLVICHCTQCQRQSGSAFGMSLIVPEDALEIWKGDLRCFTRDADSGGKLDCYFCPDCGTRIYHQRHDGAGTRNVKPGTLDDTSWLSPQVSVWMKCKQPWVQLPEGLPTMDEQPSMG